MATIPDTQQFHTVAGKVDTANKGSELANADRRSYTMQDIKDTVSAGGGVDGSGTAGNISKWSDANTLTDSILSESGSVVTVTGALTATATLVGGNVSAVVESKAAIFTLSALNTAPATAGSTGTTGEIRFVNEDPNGAIYLCIDTDTWVKVALATF